MKNNMGKFQMPSDIAGGVKMIEGDDRVREQKCLDVINQVLAQFDCAMVPEVVISGPNIMTRVSIVAKKRGPNNGPGKVPQ